MYKRIIVFVTILFCVTHNYAQKISLPDSLLQKTIVTVDTAQVKASEFIWFYNKYNSYVDSSLVLDLQQYINMFVEYKMKIIEAERLQLDTSAKFNEEFNSYVKSTAYTYLYDSKVEENLIKLEYERLFTDYQVAHIFIKSPKHSSPVDTLTAFNKAVKLKKELQAGADFAEYAKKYSEDSFTNQNGGSLGYITAMLLPYEYENAVYSSKNSNVIGPINTYQGYYLVKVTNKRPTQGQAKTSIIVVYPSSKDDAGWKTAKSTIDSVYSRLQAGEKFEDLSDIYNKNQQLQSTKGNIGWMDNAMRYHSMMKDSVFALKKIGDFTQPLLFDYGYVICLLTGRDSLADYKTYSSIIAKAIAKDESRKNMVRKEFVKKYKKQLQFKQNAKNVDEFVTLVDNSIVSGKWIQPNYKNNKVLFTIENKNYTFDDFSKFLNSSQKDRKITDKQILIRTRLEDFSDKMIEAHTIEQLPSVENEFAMIKEEYHDGMIIYELINNQIYQKANNDSVGLRNFYNDNVMNYMNNEGVMITKYMCKDANVVKKTIQLIKKQKSEYFADQFIVSQINAKQMDNIIMDTAIYYKGQDSFIDSLVWEKGTYHILDGNKILVVSNVIPVQPKSFEECKIDVITDYQVFLESKWIMYLRDKYKYSINQSLFNTLQQSIQ